MEEVLAQKQVMARLWRKGNPSALLVGMQTGAATVGNSMALPQKLKMGLPSGPAIPLLRIYPNTPQKTIRKNIYTLCSLQRYLK